MKIRKILTAIAISLTSQVSAQWDTLNTGVDLKLRGVAFLNETTGVVVGHNQTGTEGNICLQTSDRGNTWSNFVGNGTGDHQYLDVTFTPIGTIWIIGDSGLYLHKNFPLTSHIASGYLTTSSLLCCVALNDSAFYCAGELGLAFRTFDYGLTWDTLSTGTTETINDIYFEDAANGWIAADGGYLAMTSDSGNTWNFVSQPFWGFADYNSIALQGSTGMNPYVVGESGIALFSVNSGTNWFPLATDTTVNLNAVRFGTQNAGLICGDNGFIFRTENGGTTWIAETSASHVDLYDIAFAGDTIAFICGDSGVVLRSNVDISSVHTTTTASLSASAYPNPFSDNLSVNVTLESTQDVEILITDVTGQLLSSSKYSNTNSDANRFEISGTENIASGLYFITVIANDRKSVLPVVRQ